MKQNIKKMKSELKQLAKSIKEKKSHRKDRSADGTAGCGFVSGLYNASRAFRHKHVAYCLVRGRTLEQVDSGNGLNESWVSWILKSMQPESKQKLYVVVNQNLTPSQQAVQAGHAVAEFLKQNPDTQWSNGHLIYLKDIPNYSGNMSTYGALRNEMHQYAEFKEPDLENKTTAYACFGPDAETILKRMPLL